MKPLDFLAWAALTAAFSLAMTKSLGDPAVGIALGAAVATAIQTANRSKGRGRGECVGRKD